MITCVPNGRRYVGQSVDIDRRLHQHFYLLRVGRACNQIMQSSWDKYGEESFEAEILEECNESSLVDREKHWINTKQTWYSEGGFNIVEPDRSGRRDVPLPVSAVEKIVESKSQTLTAFGKTKTYKEWEKETGLSADTIYNRVRSGWDAEKTITSRSRNYSDFGFGDVLGSMTEVCKQLGISNSVVKQRIYRGWCPTRAILTPKRKRG